MISSSTSTTDKTMKTVAAAKLSTRRRTTIGGGSSISRSSTILLYINSSSSSSRNGTTMRNNNIRGPTMTRRQFVTVVRSPPPCQYFNYDQARKRVDMSRRLAGCAVSDRIIKLYPRDNAIRNAYDSRSMASSTSPPSTSSTTTTMNEEWGRSNEPKDTRSSSSPSSPSHWYKVANGAQMVASAAIQYSVRDVSRTGRQIAHHGYDLSMKASSTFEQQQQQQQSSGSSSVVPFVSLLQEVVTNAAEQWLKQQQQQQQQHQHRPAQSYDETTVSQGTAPYESQLRRKLQQQQQKHGQQDKILRNDDRESEGEKAEDSDFNPYLFHSTKSFTKEQAKETIPLTNPENDTTQNLAVKAAPTSSVVNNSNQNESVEKVEAPPTTKDNEGTNLSAPTLANTRLREGRAVPSTRFGRALGFASLGVGLAWGTMGEMAGRAIGNRPSSPLSSSVVTTDANADRLAATLCRMRGAALKMGQMLSIQDESLLPPALTRALQQVRQGAEAMPSWQLNQQLQDQLGPGWKSKFLSFDDHPFAAASIGQVHRAQIRHTTQNESGTNTTIKDVVVKVQFPGVAKSIESDLGNLSMLVKMSGLSPKGLFIENVIRVGRDELKVECNYLNELANQETFQNLVHNDPVLRSNNFVVPDVVEELSTEQVLTSAYAPGGTIDQVAQLTDQNERNRIGRTILYLTMQELFEWRLMQTDPNWGNFLYDPTTRTTSLIDFGATREFPKSFVDGYLRIVWASASRDKDTLMEQSHKMKFLTGEENDIMLNAHKLSGFTVGEPFWNDEPFDFRGSNISSRMSEHTSVFLRHRLTPPPEEVYTLHRKLAGAYMLCIKLGAVIKCRDMLESVVRNHAFEDGLPNPVTGK